MAEAIRAACVGIVLLAVPSLASAADEPPLAAEDAELLTSAADVLFDRGEKAFDARDWARAAEHWEAAHRVLEELPELDPRWQRVALRLAHAHVRANAIDHDDRRLFRARALLETVTAGIHREGHAVSATEQADADRAEELLELIRYRLLYAEELVAARMPTQPPVPTERAAAPASRRSTVLIATGASGLAVGIIALGVSADLQRRIRQDDADPLTETRGSLQAGRTAAIATGSILVAAGAIALTYGIVERRRLVRAAPMLALGTIGVALGGAF